MFCKKCGADAGEGKFCPQCGSPVVTPSPEDNGPEIMNAAENQNGVPATDTFDVPGAAQKKKNGAPKIIAVAAALIALILVGVICFGRLSGGAVKSYQSIERQTIETLKANASNFAQFSGVGSTDTSISLSLTGDGKDFIDNTETNWINTVLLDVNSASDEKKAHSAGTLNINDTKILSFETLTEMPGNEIFLKFPDFSQQYIKTNFSGDFMKLFRSSSPDMDALSAVIERYGELVISNLTKVEKGKESVTVGSTTSEYKTFSITIDDETSDNISRAISETARDDRDLEKLIRSSAESSGEDADAAYSEFLANLDEAENREEGAENKVLATMTVYVDGKGDVCGRRYVSADEPDKADYHLTAWNGKNFETEVKLSTDDGIISIKGSGTRDGNIISGDYTIVSDDVNVAAVRVDNFDKTAAKAGKISGTFTVTPGKDYIDETGSNPLMASLKYKIDINSESGKADSVITLLSDAAELGTIKINRSASKDFEIPSVGDNEKVDVEAWAGSVDLENLQNTLVKALTDAGAPEELLN